MPRKRVIIIGSGLAAMTVAERLTMHTNVIIFTKSKVETCHSRLAQGGISACLGSDDDWRLHFQDTIEAGCRHNDEAAVSLLVRTGTAYMTELMEKGMKFDRDAQGGLMLGKEGAHSRNRIIHAGGDATGQKLMDHLGKSIRGKLTVVENKMVVDLLIEDGRCTGVITKDPDGRVKFYPASHVVLATGGASGLYQHSSGDPSIVGDGLAMAYRAGAELADLEFFQFHPTLLPGGGLISEAVRGEGARLVTEERTPIMDGVHPMADLAPRDIVARAIFDCNRRGVDVFLDVSMIEPFSLRFPTVTSICRENGIDLQSGVIPVVPGSHFSMGGVKTDADGRSSIPGLYAVGEVACTGVHGANRLASNSLLEAIVFGNRAADHILKDDTECSSRNLEIMHTGIFDETLPTKSEIQDVMSRHVGIVRTKEGLEYAASWFEREKSKFLQKELWELSIPQLEVVNMLTVGWLMATSALMREESRGAHFRLDFPLEDDGRWLKRQVIRINEGVLV